MTADLTTHPDWRPLCAAVCARPGDDLPRLVAADWLDEHGHGEYAEFVRVQIALGGLKNLLVMKHNAPDRVLALRQRERELVNCRTPRREWFGDIGRLVLKFETIGDTPPGPDGFAIVRRGFVAEVRGSLADLLGGSCPDCHGVDGISLDTGRTNCDRCDGSGVVRGVLPRLVGRQPVEAVGVSDREPDEVLAPEPFLWWSGVGVGERSLIPDEVFDLLPGKPDVHPSPVTLDDSDPHKHYPTRDAAIAALSAAVLKRAGEVTPSPTPVV